MIKRILVDLDGVLADFDEGACRAHGIFKEAFHEARQPGQWLLPPIFAEIRGEIMSMEEFWRVINDAGSDFWSGLGQMPWMTQLTNLVRDAVPDWHIISAPSWSSLCHQGKVEWIRCRLGKQFDRFAFTPHKEIFAQPGVLLIDDREENVQRFVAAGGVGMIFPTMGNRLHELSDDPMSYVRQELKKLEVI